MTKPWADELEDMGQAQKLLFTTRLLSVVNICTKYEKDPWKESFGADRIFSPIFWQCREQMTLKIWDKVKSCYTRHASS